MRAGLKDKQILFDGYGFNLGWDFVAEHEWGIKGLKQKFGIPELTKKTAGIKSRINTICPDDLLFEETKDASYLVRASYHYGERTASQYDENIMRENYVDGQSFYSAWDEASFGVKVVDNQLFPNLKELYKALRNKNGLITISDRGVFGNSGLVICIADCVPVSSQKVMLEEDLDYIKLHKTAEKTGIKKKIDKLNTEHRKIEKSFRGPCDYFCLEPRWKMENKNSKYDVVFWLNPNNQKENNSGLFTVEELEQWLEGKGPVVKGSKTYILY